MEVNSTRMDIVYCPWLCVGYFQYVGILLKFFEFFERFNLEPLDLSIFGSDSLQKFLEFISIFLLVENGKCWVQTVRK